MTYCLRTNQIVAFLRFVQEESQTYDECLQYRFDEAKEWRGDLVCPTILFVRVLERFRDDNEECQRLIRLLFKVPEDMRFDIEECGAKFSEYVVRNVYNPEDDLEEELSSLVEDYRDHQYAKTIRYRH